VAYRLPTFALTVNVWRNGNPTTNPPDAIILGNLALGRRVYQGDVVEEPPTAKLPTVFLLCPFASDIIGDINSAGSPDTVEVDDASGWFYTVHYVDRVGLGFSNQHYVAWLRPIPGTTPPPPAGELLLEDGTFVLLEDGTFIELE
jgi:hypothetical protein